MRKSYLATIHGASTLLLCLRQADAFSAASPSSISTADSSSNQRQRPNPNCTENRGGRRRRSLALLTFDLDDTLFPCGPVVAEANEAMIASIVAHGYPTVTNADVLAATKAIRNDLRQAADDNNAPITYTDLRIAAIQSQLQKSLEERFPHLGLDRGGGALPHESVSRKIFRVWLAARHEAAERNLYPGAVDMLRRIRADHPGAVIGAVTNGRGDPLDMRRTLRPFFDFTVSGEDADVFPHRKPQPGIYEVTLDRFESVAGYDLRPELGREQDGRQDGRGCWVHVGDDLANDVGASAACGAKAVWYDMDDEEGEGEKEEGTTPFYSTASAEEIERRKRMAAQAEALVTERISTLAQLPTAIENILSDRG